MPVKLLLLASVGPFQVALRVRSLFSPGYSAPCEGPYWLLSPIPGVTITGPLFDPGISPQSWTETPFNVPFALAQGPEAA
jgi:hypothetical protein